VLLMYSLGTNESYLWVVTPQKIAVARIAPRKTIEDQVLKLRSQLVPGIGQRGLDGIDLSSDATRSLDLGTDGQPPPRVNQAKDAGAYAAAANDLYNTILGPAAPMLEGKRLLVMADGALNYVPFAALVTSIPAGKADFVTLPYLIRSNEIVYAPSASVINQLHQQAQQARSAGGNASSNSMLILADPVFSSSDARLKGGGTPVIKASDSSGGVSRQLTLDTAVGDIVGKPAAGLKIPRLINTRKEANDISELAGADKTKADVWLDLDASESNVFSRDMQGYQILHFATHGLLNTEHPGFTGLVLSLVGESEGDGFLRVSEIFNLKLGAPLVMLSACETGLGKEKRGEGIMGLSRAFMYAGAPTVGVSLWAVSDRSTARLMTDFYSSYLADKNATAAGALRQAQLKMIADPQVSAPYYWAPFVIVGDWAHN
jgi:CHAT domain-containing protein